MFLTPLCILSEHEGRRPVLQPGGRPRQPARPCPVWDEPQGEDSHSQRPRDEPGGRAGAAQGAARGSYLPEPPSGSWDPRVPQRFSVRQSVVLRQPRMIQPRTERSSSSPQTIRPSTALNCTVMLLTRRHLWGKETVPCWCPQEHCGDDAFSSSLLQLERWIDRLLLRISNKHEAKSHPNNIGCSLFSQSDSTVDTL